MPHAGLIDTGVILAVVESGDDWHSACIESLRSARLPLLTSEAVLTEAFHLIGSTSYNKQRVWDFVLSGAITINGISDSDLPALRTLMMTYKDRPMDFADATLVHIANREAINTIFTIDHDDFETYRLKGNKKFIVRPSRDALRG